MSATSDAVLLELETMLTAIHVTVSEKLTASGKFACVRDTAADALELVRGELCARGLPHGQHWRGDTGTPGAPCGGSYPPPARANANRVAGELEPLAGGTGES